MSAYIKKMETIQKQHAFSCSSVVPKFWFQNQFVWQNDPKITIKSNPLCGVVILCNQPSHAAQGYGKELPERCPKTAPRAAAEGAQQFWNQNTHLAPGGHGWALVSNHDSESDDSNSLGIRANLENRGTMSTFKAGLNPFGLGCVSSSAHWLSSLLEWVGASICPAW